jgi:hypothetical protein
MNNSRKE